jgi:hypothetical protein
LDQTNSTAAIAAVCRFIGVRAPELKIDAKHSSTTPKSVQWNYFARSLIDSVVPKGNRAYQIANTVRSRIFLGKRPPQALDEDLKRKLSDTFADDQEKFHNLRPTFEIDV